MKKSRVLTSLLIVIGLTFLLLLPTATVNVGQKEIRVGLAGVAYASETPDYTADGTADNVQVQQALDALPTTGGKLRILAGTYNFSATVTRAIPNVTIEGSGKNTILNYNGAAPLFTAGSNGWTFKDFATDAGGVSTGATTGWAMENVTLGSTFYALYNYSGLLTLNDISLSRVAANILGLAAGDSFRISSTGQLQFDSDKVRIWGTRGIANHGDIIIQSQIGTNSFSHLMVMPKGTGLGVDKAEISIWNTDWVADPTETCLERLYIEAVTTLFGIVSEAKGTGVVRPLGFYVAPLGVAVPSATMNADGTWTFWKQIGMDANIDLAVHQLTNVETMYGASAAVGMTLSSIRTAANVGPGLIFKSYNAADAPVDRMYITSGENVAWANWTNCKQVFDATSLPNGDPHVPGQLYYLSATGVVMRSNG